MNLGQWIITICHPLGRLQKDIVTYADQEGPLQMGKIRTGHGIGTHAQPLSVYQIMKSERSASHHRFDGGKEVSVTRG